MKTDSASGHYDLLYKAEDIAQMSIAALANPEVRFLSDYPAFAASEATAFSYTADLGLLADIPGFSMGIAPTYSSLPYHQPKSEPSPPKTRLSPSMKESLSPASPGTSRTSPTRSEPENFRVSIEQLEYNYEFIKDRKSLSAEPERTNSARE